MADEKVECPICLENVNFWWTESLHRNANINQSSHRVCKTCYMKILNKSKNDIIECPLCRKDIVSEKDTNDLGKEQLTIYIKIGFMGKIYALHVLPSNTILDIKKKMQEQIGIPPEVIHTVLYFGKRLSDHETLSKQNLKHGAELIFLLHGL
jgi:hypothetical protein